MNLLQEAEIGCPYCGEINTILVDGSIDEQHYIEDCQVCCRPMVLLTSIGAGGRIQVEARREDDA